MNNNQHMNSHGQGGGQKDNPNHVRRLYRLNIIFLSCLTILSLLFAIFIYFRLKSQGTDGIRKIYTDKQINNIKEAAASRERDALLLKIQSSLESGQSTTRMLREIFYDSIVVLKGGRYYFFPVSAGVEENPIPDGTLIREDGQVTFTGDYPAVKITQGVLLSDDNGRIDWDRLAESGVEEVMLTAGRITADGFILDQQFERNRMNAALKDLPWGICIEVRDPVKTEKMKEIFEAVGEAVPDCFEDQSEEAASEGAADREDVPRTVLLRIRSEQEMPQDESESREWTRTVRTLCERLQDAGADPVVGADLFTYAAQIDLEDLAETDRWLIQHEDTAFFPYRFSYWEYSGEGHLEGVPGDSAFYAHIRNVERLEISEKNNQ